MKVANQLVIDFDTVPVEIASTLASKIEAFVNSECKNIALHGTLAQFDEDVLCHESGRRALERLAGEDWTQLKGTQLKGTGLKGTGCTCGEYAGTSVYMADCPVHNRPVLTDEPGKVTKLTGPNSVSDPGYALSDCVNYETNVYGDCGGRVEFVNGRVICETCRNKPEEKLYLVCDQGEAFDDIKIAFEHVENGGCDEGVFSIQTERNAL